MKKSSGRKRSAVDPVEDVPRILDAMRAAVRAALLDHKRAGNPVAVWRDGKVVWIPPEEIPVEGDPEDAERRPPARESPGRRRGPGGKRRGPRRVSES